MLDPLCCVYQQVTYFGNLSQGSSLLSEVDDYATSTILRLLDGFLDTKDEVWSASTDVRSEHVTAVALARGKLRPDGKSWGPYLVVDSQRQSNRLIRHLRRIPEAVDSKATLKLLVDSLPARFRD